MRKCCGADNHRTAYAHPNSSLERYGIYKGASAPRIVPTGNRDCNRRAIAGRPAYARGNATARAYAMYNSIGAASVSTLNRSVGNISSCAILGRPDYARRNGTANAYERYSRGVMRALPCTRSCRCSKVGVTTLSFSCAYSGYNSISGITTAGILTNLTKDGFGGGASRTRGKCVCSIGGSNCVGIHSCSVVVTSSGGLLNGWGWVGVLGNNGFLPPFFLLFFALLLGCVVV